MNLLSITLIRPMKQSVYAMAFTTGFSIMSVELLSGKMMAPYFGSSIYVWGSIITVFMLALSIGYLWGGRLSLNNASIKKYSALFFVSGLLIVVVPFLKTPIFELASGFEDPRYGSLVGAFLLFMPATVLMGMISPYSVRLLATSQQTSGNTAGTLYFVSTLGSALGTILTSFYFVMWFELDVLFYGIGLLMFLQAFFPWLTGYTEID